MIQEVWKDIPWFEWLYQASNQWQIRSIIFRNNKTIKKRELILKYQINKWYCYVWLHLNGKVYTKKVHRLVLSAFLWDSTLHCNHKDKNRLNNKLSNLEWVTTKENNTHKMLFWDLIYKKWYSNSLCRKVYVFSYSWEYLFNCPWIVVASLITWADHWDISRCCNWKIKFVSKFIFRYSTIIS